MARDARILALNIENFAGSTQDEIEGLPVEAIEPRRQAAAIDASVKTVKRLEERASLTQAIECNLQVHIVSRVATRIERCKRWSEPGGAVRIDVADPDVSRQTGAWIVSATDSSQDRADARFDSGLVIICRWIVVTGHDPVGTARVAGIGVSERSDEGHAVGDASHLREDATDLDAGDVGLHRADRASVFDWRGHLWVEGLDVRRSAPEPKPDDGGVASLAALGPG